jgi:hypothetical protein
MKKYMLISVCDREILTERFDTHEEAFEQMKKEMIEQGKVPAEIFENDHYEDYDCGFGSECGWANDGINHADFDWRIINLGEEED